MARQVYNIGVEATMDVIGGKWKSIILCNLRHQTMRTSELRRVIPNISERVLIQQLKELEQSNIIIRKAYNQIPPKVEYYLSPYGETLGDILDLLCEWGNKHVEVLQAAGVDVELACGNKHLK